MFGRAFMCNEFLACSLSCRRAVRQFLSSRQCAKLSIQSRYVDRSIGRSEETNSRQHFSSFKTMLVRAVNLANNSLTPIEVDNCANFANRLILPAGQCSIRAKIEHAIRPVKHSLLQAVTFRDASAAKLPLQLHSQLGWRHRILGCGALV
jgi:hypothetical protein